MSRIHRPNALVVGLVSKLFRFGYRQDPDDIRGLPLPSFPGCDDISDHTHTHTQFLPFRSRADDPLRRVVADLADPELSAHDILLNCVNHEVDPRPFPCVL